MADSLKDQLLSAGLITKDQARKNSRKQRPKKGKKRVLDPEAQEQSDRIRQILSSRGLPKAGIDEETSRFYFQLDKRVHNLHVTAAQRAQLVGGKCGIVLFDGHYHLLPIEHAQRIQALTPQRVWVGTDEDDQPSDEDDPYAGYEVPDDLIW